MQLRTARLCADCEEVHTEQVCPVCGSESFAFLSRWIPVEERRSRRRRPLPAAAVAPEKSALENSALGSWVKLGTIGTIGLAVVAAGRWFWLSNQPAKTSAQPSNGDGQTARSREDDRV